jgi:hypothetical protein
MIFDIMARPARSARYGARRSGCGANEKGGAFRFEMKLKICPLGPFLCPFIGRRRGELDQ